MPEEQLFAARLWVCEEETKLEKGAELPEDAHRLRKGK